MKISYQWDKMQLIDIQPIPGEPALFVKKLNLIIIADLHIGIESELREHGLHTPSQTKQMTQHIISLCEKYYAKQLILLGDIKHNIPFSPFQERYDIKQFLEGLHPYATIHIIPGNHDGNIQRLTPNTIHLHSSLGLVIENIGFFHGHRWPNENVISCEYIIFGHTHPTIQFTDRLHHKTIEACWVKAKFKNKKIREKYTSVNDPQIIIIPAFNPLCGGISINREGVTGPMGKVVDVKNAEIYLLDGSFLGKVHDIK